MLCSRTGRTTSSRVDTEGVAGLGMRVLKYIVIYTDGACIRNPGPGGYGVVLLHKKVRKELSAGYRKTTSNRMEILAAIKGLEGLKQRCRVTLYSDSQYLVKAMTQGWVKRWRANGWKRNRNDKALNSDLWDRLLNLCECHQVEFRWVRGHANNAENRRCDQLATEAVQQHNLLIDEGYEAKLHQCLTHLKAVFEQQEDG